MRESTGLALDVLDVLIAQRAFERYQARGCQNGCNLDDWLEAEREILRQIPLAENKRHNKQPRSNRFEFERF